MIEIITKNRNSIQINAQPSSKKTQIISYDKDKDCYKIALKAPAEDGKANKELISFLKKRLGRDIEIVKGKTAHKKIIRLL